jgi:hypothetical protein
MTWALITTDVSISIQSSASNVECFGIFLLKLGVYILTTYITPKQYKIYLVVYSIKYGMQPEISNSIGIIPHPLK